MVPAAGFEPAPLQGLNLMSLPIGRRRHRLVGEVGLEPTEPLTTVLQTVPLPFTVYSPIFGQERRLSRQLRTRYGDFYQVTSNSGDTYLLLLHVCPIFQYIS